MPPSAPTAGGGVIKTPRSTTKTFSPDPSAIMPAWFSKMASS
jgi:hypothetical protein